MKATVLMIEAEMGEGISARKLVLESDRYNVITAYDAAEGLQLFRKFINTDVVIIHANVRGMSCGELAQHVKDLRPDVPVIALVPNGSNVCQAADYVVSSHEPEALLGLLSEKFSSTAAD